MSTDVPRVWSRQQARWALVVATVVLVSGVVVAAAREPAPATSRVLTDATTAPTARPAADAAAGPAAQAAPISAADPTTTAAPASAGPPAAVAPPPTSGADLAAEPDAGAAAPGSAADPADSWKPGDPYPPEWAALDAAKGMPPYPYVVPDTCRAGEAPWAANLWASRTVEVAGGGRITVTVWPCVIFAGEAFAYTVTMTGPLRVAVWRGNVGELISPAVHCPTQPFTSVPMDLSSTWTSEPQYSLGYYPPTGVGVTEVTVSVTWQAFASVAPAIPVSEPTYYCTQIAAGVADVTLPVVIEQWRRPEEMGGSFRGPTRNLNTTG